MLFFKMAWRNIWRNKQRTLITVAVMSFSLFFMIFMLSMATGYHGDIIKNAAKAGLGHIQIHKKDFQTLFNAKYYMEVDPNIEKVLKADEDIDAFSFRVKGPAIINYTNKSQSVIVLGIKPKEEPKISVFHKKIDPKTGKGILLEGDYILEDDWKEGFSGDDIEGTFRVPGMLIGIKTAKNFKVKVGNRIVLTLQSRTGEIKQHLFKVRGIFRTLDPSYDKGTVIIHYKTAQKLFFQNKKKSSNYDYFSEIAIIAKSNKVVDNLTNVLKEKFKDKDYEILKWYEINPGLLEFITMDSLFGWIFVAILFVVVIIGIIITLLMAIFERIREFGVMRAVGMTNKRLRYLILLESFWLSIISCIVGGALGITVVTILGTQGLDLAEMAPDQEKSADLISRVKKIVSDETGISIDKVEPNSRFDKDLKVDKEKFSKIIKSMKENFSLSEAKEFKMKDYSTLNHIINYIKKVRPDLAANVTVMKISLDTVVYPKITLPAVLFCFIFLILSTLVVSLYPAYKANKIEVIEALNFI